MGSASRKAEASSGVMTVSPSGLLRSEAIFAEKLAIGDTRGSRKLSIFPYLSLDFSRKLYSLIQVMN